MFGEVSADTLRNFRFIEISSIQTNFLENSIYDQGGILVVHEEFVDIVDGLYRVCDIVHMESKGGVGYFSLSVVQNDFDGTEIKERCEKVWIAALNEFDIAHQLYGLNIRMYSYLIHEINFSGDDENIIHFQIYYTPPVVRDEQDLGTEQDDMEIRSQACLIAGNKEEAIYLKNSNDYGKEVAEGDLIEELGKYAVSLRQSPLSFVDIENIVGSAAYFVETENMD